MIRRVLARMLRWGVAAIVALLAVGTAWQWARSRSDVAATPAPGELFDVGGHRLHLWCVGAGTPAVVFDSGLGGGAFDWGHVQPAVGQRRRACTYDRAGMGYSEPGPGPRTSLQIANELARLADRAAIASPFVLVGGSFGGYNVRVFASEHPQLVAGLVLVDASHEDQGRRYAEAGLNPGELPAFAPYLLPIAAMAGAPRLLGFSVGVGVGAIAPDSRAYVAATRFRTSVFRNTAQEYLAIEESAAQVRAARRPADVPLVVLSRTRGRDTPSGRVHDEMQAEYPALSMRSCRTGVAESGHLIQNDQPWAVIAAIEAVAAASISGAAPQCPPSQR